MATGRKSNLSTIAKKSTPAKKTTKAKAKPAVEKVEDKDVKTKQKMEDLLKDLPTGPKDDLLELDEATEETDKGSLEWLQEQVDTLTARNQELEVKSAQAESDYKKIYQDYQDLKAGNPAAASVTDDGVKKNVYVLFNEVQNHYAKTGKDFRLAPVAFLNRMIMYFPFLQGQMKF